MPRIVTGTEASVRTRTLALPTTGIQLVDLALSAIATAMRTLMAHPRVEQTTVRDVAFVSGVAQVVEHRLGRAFKGWSVVRVRDNAAAFVEVAQDTELDEIQLQLSATADCIADVEVW